MLQLATAAPQRTAPLDAVVVAADYNATVEQGRVRIAGVLSVAVLKPGLHATPLQLEGVGVRRAALDGAPAAIGTDSDGQTVLFVQDQGSKQLVLDLVAPLTAVAAEQTLQFRLPTPNAIYFDTNGGGFSFSLSAFCSLAFCSVFINLVLLGRRGCAGRA